MADPKRVAFITGAGRGIGKALALGFAREGYRVVVGSTTPDRNEAVAAQIEAGGGEAVPVLLDVTQEARVQAAVGRAVDRFGRIDVLINNAGLKQGFVPAEQRLIKDLSLSVWQRMFETNVTGPLLCARECSQAMIAQGGGSIINVSSGAGLNAREGNGPYAMTKAAVNMLTRVLAVELRQHQIAVNAILPGFTAVEGTNVERWAPAMRATALKPETSLPLVLFLAGQEPIEVSGEIIDVLDWNVAHGLGGPEVWGVGT